ncbi:hypothetical protein H4R24_005366 [Coemansia sp. RSA 988]|nr:hypothetical protein H4R24_005366 [Coemansia sp. RSA 988]
MSHDAAGDRETRRRARYRGNPERTRFRRQSNVEEFVIRVEEPRHDNREESLTLVQGMRGISLAGHRSTDTECVDKSGTANHPALSTCADQDVSRDSRSSSVIESRNDSGYLRTRQLSTESPISKRPEADLAKVHVSDCHNSTIVSGDNSEISSSEHSSAVESAAQKETHEDPPTLKQPPTASESDDARTNVGHVEEPATTTRRRPRASKTERGPPGNKPVVGRARRQRENINTKDIELVAQEAPARMTRSMARKLDVQRPRRHFGEGVSTSQILRPGGCAGSRLEPT